MRDRTTLVPRFMPRRLANKTTCERRSAHCLFGESAVCIRFLASPGATGHTLEGPARPYTPIRIRNPDTVSNLFGPQLVGDRAGRGTWGSLVPTRIEQECGVLGQILNGARLASADRNGSRICDSRTSGWRGREKRNPCTSATWLSRNRSI